MASNIYNCAFTGEQIEEAIGMVLHGRAVLVTNCPNCGAPIQGGACPYCGTRFLKCAEKEDHNAP